ncbi:hypothetical protein AVL62_12560 [Serinicoccus chungangensis]|uniref:Uncharacterized protein n=1 Tax=Serinicoccus chungangensis TaxID=767452 RepID=A0A0W8I0K6_9MICO|nr:hypothetical protein [Serinicoccus chungangensis]KUG51078.1 hypothetical protein AVL62_12560 [Serinicoccus chungangensis]
MDEQVDEQAEESGEEALRAAVSAVYAAAPADFVATRKEWVGRLRSQGRKDLAKEVGALRKPSVSAAAVNALVRAGDPAAERLKEVGARLRHAQSAMDVTGLQELRAERDAVLAAWVAAARRHAPVPLTAGGESEVRDTGVAALAGADATEVVLGGTLTRALAYSGFGEVDVADAVARTSTGVVLTRIEGGGAEDEPAPAVAGDPSRDDDGATPAGPDGAAEEPDDSDALQRLQDELEAAEAEVGRARETRKEAAATAARRRDELGVARSGVEQARRLLAQAEQHATTAQERADRAQGEEDAADEGLAAARAARDEARRRLEEAQDAG